MIRKGSSRFCSVIWRSYFVLINPYQMIKTETTLLFHDEKVYIFLMISVDFLTRQGRKLQLSFMCCLVPFPGRSVPPQLSLSPQAPAPLLLVTKPNTAAQGRTASSPPAPLALGHDYQGGSRLRDIAPVPHTRRGGSKRTGREENTCRLPPATAGSPCSGN